MARFNQEPAARAVSLASGGTSSMAWCAAGAVIAEAALEGRPGFLDSLPVWPAELPAQQG